MEVAFPASNFDSEAENRLNVGGKNKRKSNRRSSILKNKSPSKGVLEDLDPNSLQETGRSSKISRRSSGRRVSFATKNEVKEFSAEPIDWSEHWRKELDVLKSQEIPEADGELCEYRQPPSTLKGIQSLLMGSIRPEQDAQLTDEECITYKSIVDEVDFTMCQGGGILPATGSQPPTLGTQVLDMTQCYGQGVPYSSGAGLIADQTKCFNVDTDEAAQLQMTSCHGYGVMGKTDTVAEDYSKVNRDQWCSEVELTVCHGQGIVQSPTLSTGQKESHGFSGGTRSNSGKVNWKLFLDSLGESKEPPLEEPNELDLQTVCHGHGFVSGEPSLSRQQIASHNSSGSKIDLKSLKSPRYEDAQGYQGMHQGVDSVKGPSRPLMYPKTRQTENRIKVDGRSFLDSLEEPSELELTACHGQGFVSGEPPSARQQIESHDISGSKIDPKFLKSARYKDAQGYHRGVDSIKGPSRTLMYPQARKTENPVKVDGQSFLASLEEPSELELTACHGQGLVSVEPSFTRQQIESHDISGSKIDRKFLKSARNKDAQSDQGVQRGVHSTKGPSRPLMYPQARKTENPIKVDGQSFLASLEEPSELELTACHGQGFISEEPSLSEENTSHIHLSRSKINQARQSVDHGKADANSCPASMITRSKPLQEHFDTAAMMTYRPDELQEKIESRAFLVGLLTPPKGDPSWIPPKARVTLDWTTRQSCSQANDFNPTMRHGSNGGQPLGQVCSDGVDVINSHDPEILFQTKRQTGHRSEGLNLAVCRGQDILPMSGTLPYNQIQSHTKNNRETKDVNHPSCVGAGIRLSIQKAERSRKRPFCHSSRQEDGMDLTYGHGGRRILAAPVKEQETVDVTHNMDQTACVGKVLSTVDWKTRESGKKGKTLEQEEEDVDLTFGYGGRILAAPVKEQERVGVTHNMDQTACVGKVLSTEDWKTKESGKKGKNQEQEEDVDLTFGYGGRILAAPVKERETVGVTHNMDQTACVGKVLSKEDWKTKESGKKGKNQEQEEDIDITFGYGGRILAAPVTEQETVGVTHNMDQTACVGKVLSKDDWKTKESDKKSKTLEQEEDVDITFGYGGRILAAPVKEQETVGVTHNMDQTACVGKVLSTEDWKTKESGKKGKNQEQEEDVDLTFGYGGRILAAPVKERETVGVTHNMDQTACVGKVLSTEDWKTKESGKKGKNQEEDIDLTFGYGGRILAAPVNERETVGVSHNMDQTACVGKVLLTEDWKTRESSKKGNTLEKEEDIGLSFGYGGGVLAETVGVTHNMDQTACAGKVISKEDWKTKESGKKGKTLEQEEDVDITFGYGGQILAAPVKEQETVGVAHNMDQTACVGKVLLTEDWKTREYNKKGNTLYAGRILAETVGVTRMDQTACVGKMLSTEDTKPLVSSKKGNNLEKEEDKDLTFGYGGGSLAAPVRDEEIFSGMHDVNQATCVGKEILQAGHVIQDSGTRSSKQKNWIGVTPGCSGRILTASMRDHKTVCVTQDVDQTAGIGKILDHETQYPGKQYVLCAQESPVPFSETTSGEGVSRASLDDPDVTQSMDCTVCDSVPTASALPNSNVDHQLNENSHNTAEIEELMNTTPCVEPENVEVNTAKQNIAVFGRSRAEMGDTKDCTTFVPLATLRARMKEKKNSTGVFQSQSEMGGPVNLATRPTALNAQPATTANVATDTQNRGETEKPMDTTTPAPPTYSMDSTGCRLQTTAASYISGMDRSLQAVESIDTLKCDFDQNLSVTMEEMRDESTLARNTQDSVLEPLTVDDFFGETGIHFNTTDRVLMRRSSLPLRVETPREQTEKDCIRLMSVVMPKLTFYKEAADAVEKEMPAMEKKVELLEQEFNARNPAIFQETLTASAGTYDSLRESLISWKTRCERTAKTKWKSNKHQMKAVLPARIKEKLQQLVDDVHALEESLGMAQECLALLEESDRSVEARTEELKGHLSASEKEYETCVHNSEEQEEILKSQNLELKELEAQRTCLTSERDELTAQKQRLEREQLETEARLHTLATGDSTDPRLEELSQIHTIIESLQEWSLEEFDDKRAVFTFLEDAVELTVVFGQQNDHSCASSNEKLMESISLNTHFTDNHLSSQLTEAVIKETINMESLRNKYEGSTSLPQLLDHLSCVLCKIRRLSREVFSVGVRNLMSVRGTTLSVEFASFKAFLKFVVEFSFDMNTYPDVLDRKITVRIGHCSVNDVKESLNAVEPGPRYVTRLVEAAVQFLEIRKKSNQ